MTKKFIVFIFTACIALTCFTCSVSATVSDPNIVPMSTYYRSAYSKIDISTNGTVTIKGSITGYRGTTTKTSVHLYLQNTQINNGLMWLTGHLQQILQVALFRKVKQYRKENIDLKQYAQRMQEPKAKK